MREITFTKLLLYYIVFIIIVNLLLCLGYTVNFIIDIYALGKILYVRFCAVHIFSLPQRSIKTHHTQISRTTIFGNRLFKEVCELK